MASSSESEELDPEDFWGEDEEIHNVEPDSPIKPNDFRRGATMRNPPSPTKLIFKQLSRAPEDFFKHHMATSIDKLRQENEEQIRSVKLAVRNKTRKELKSAVDEIRAQFETEVFLIKQDHDKMKDEIAKKNKEIMLIAGYMIDQETVIAQSRLQFCLKIADVDKTAEVLLEEKQLKKELGIIKVQIDAMKEAIKEYTQETVQSAAKVKELDNEIEILLRRHREELKELEIHLENRVEKAINERDAVRAEFELFKKSGWNELEEKEASCVRQREIIISLQSELKKAKGILHNPRLKLRVHERLKDYLDEYEDESNDSPSFTGIKSAIPNHRRSRTNDKRNVFTSKPNYDTSLRLTSINEGSIDFPRSRRPEHKSRFSQF